MYDTYAGAGGSYALVVPGREISFDTDAPWRQRGVWEIFFFAFGDLQHYELVQYRGM